VCLLKTRRAVREDVDQRRRQGLFSDQEQRNDQESPSAVEKSTILRVREPGFLEGRTHLRPSSVPVVVYSFKVTRRQFALRIETEVAPRRLHSATVRVAMLTGSALAVPGRNWMAPCVANGRSGGSADALNS